VSAGTGRPPSARVKPALAVAVLIVIFAGCSGAAERTLIAQFFAASRLRDLTALQSLATVVFEPATDGIVNTFDLLSVSPLQTTSVGSGLKRAMIAAPVRLPDGHIVRKTFVVTMTRGLPESVQRWDNWMITAIDAAPASPSPPPS